MPESILTAVAFLLGVLLAVGVMAFVLHLSRVRALTGRVGSFPSSIRAVDSSRWRPGVTHYAVDRLEWYRLFSVSPRPRYSWPRNEFRILSRTPLVNDGSWRERGDLCEIECDVAGRRFVLVLSVNAYEGLSSWLEAAPPGLRS